jgi:mono/diheme cytochrome c family protein
MKFSLALQMTRRIKKFGLLKTRCILHSRFCDNFCLLTQKFGMRTVLKVLLFIVAFVFVAVLSFIGFLEVRGIPKYDVEKIDFPKVQVTPERVTQGAKIAAVQCMVCHRGSDGKLSGRLLHELPPEFGEIHSANITQSKEHGIGNWPDADIAYLLRTGCKPDGQFLPVYMPKFPHLSDEDLKSVIAFLHSDQPCVQASEIAKVPSKPSLLTKFLCLVAFKKIPYPRAPISEPDSNDFVAYGHYLVTGRYDCYPCHSADFKSVNMEFPEKTPGFMGGGNTLITLEKKVRFSANLTPDQSTGLGGWTQDDFANAMLHQKNKAGKSLREPMLPYNGMTDAEIKGIWKYIQTVPPIKNEVDRKWAED